MTANRQQALDRLENRIPAGTGATWTAEDDEELARLLAELLERAVLELRTLENPRTRFHHVTVALHRALDPIAEALALSLTSTGVDVEQEITWRAGSLLEANQPQGLEPAHAERLADVLCARTLRHARQVRP